MALSITLDPTETGPLFLQIAARVRIAIARGQMSPGGRLPSSRALAAQLAVARGTVDAAYAMLAGEGAIVAHGSAGTIVAGLPGRRGQAPEQSPFAFPSASAVTPSASLPFRMGLPALEAFPRKLWSNLTVRAARASQPADLAEADPAGLYELRREISTYLGISRGIRCAPDEVLITAGYQGALALIRSVLVRPGDPVWMEDPGYHMTRQALENAGARVVPVRVDQCGLVVTAGATAAPGAKLAVVTPTHQCPTGVALTLPRRLELLTWAAEAGSWIVEDDYDSEFRYVGRPLPSLKSLDHRQRVLYAGSFSKVLFPALQTWLSGGAEGTGSRFSSRIQAADLRPVGAGAAGGGRVHASRTLRATYPSDADPLRRAAQGVGEGAGNGVRRSCHGRDGNRRHAPAGAIRERGGRYRAGKTGDGGRPGPKCTLIDGDGARLWARIAAGVHQRATHGSAGAGRSTGRSVPVIVERGSHGVGDRAGPSAAAPQADLAA